jgi:hypothetical protein
MNNRLWQKHGKLPWIEYVTETAKPTSQEIVDFAAGKILADKAKWLKRVITDPEIRALLENFKKYCEKGGK